MVISAWKGFFDFIIDEIHVVYISVQSVKRSYWYDMKLPFLLKFKWKYIWHRSNDNIVLLYTVYNILYLYHI